MEAEIAEVRAGKKPEDSLARKAAEDAAVKARASAAEAGAETNEPTPPVPPPPEVLTAVKSAFRRGAMLMHPDRATTEAEKLRRHEFMTRLNRAYEHAELETIETIIAEFGKDPEAIEGEDIGSKIIKAIRRIAQLRRRIEEITSEMDTRRQDDMYQLAKSVQETEKLGADPLGDLAARILKQISERRIELEILLSSNSQP